MHPTTYGPPHHSKNIHVNWIFSTNRMEPKDERERERSPWKETKLVWWKPSNSHDVCFETVYKLKPIETRNNTTIHTSGNVGAFFQGAVVKLGFTPKSMLFPGGKYTTLRLLERVAEISREASIRRSSINPVPANNVASEISLAASHSPSTRTRTAAPAPPWPPRTSSAPPLVGPPACLR